VNRDRPSQSGLPRREILGGVAFRPDAKGNHQERRGARGSSIVKLANQQQTGAAEAAKRRRKDKASANELRI
jgi:hypothetical protein